MGVRCHHQEAREQPCLGWGIPWDIRQGNEYRERERWSLWSCTLGSHALWGPFGFGQWKAFVEDSKTGWEWAWIVVSWIGLLDVLVWLLPSIRPSDPAKWPFKLSSLSGTLWQGCLSFGANPGIIQCPYDFPRSCMYFFKLINLLVWEFHLFPCIDTGVRWHDVCNVP